MELRQLTLNAQLESFSICAHTVLFVDQSSPRFLENFGEDISTSPEHIEAHTLHFKLNFKFSRLKLQTDHLDMLMRLKFTKCTSCGHHRRTDRRTDGQTACHGNTALCSRS